jgi:tRNA (guanosine-2'-O-)-methyltransferase
MFLLAGVEKPANVGSIFRLAEGLNAQVLLSGRTPTPPNPEIAMTSMNQEDRVVWQHFANTQEAIKYAKEQGYVVIATELCQEAKPYQEFKYPQKVCFVLGHENSGVHQEILSICDDAVFIPYWGKNFSLNVAVSAAIVAYRAVV